MQRRDEAEEKMGYIYFSPDLEEEEVCAQTTKKTASILRNPDFVVSPQSGTVTKVIPRGSRN